MTTRLMRGRSRDTKPLALVRRWEVQVFELYGGEWVPVGPPVEWVASHPYAAVAMALEAGRLAVGPSQIVRVFGIEPEIWLTYAAVSIILEELEGR